MHGTRTYFNIVRLLQDAALSNPELRKLQDQVWKVSLIACYQVFTFSFSSRLPAASSCAAFVRCDARSSPSRFA